MSDYLIPHSVYASRIWQIKSENVVTPEVDKIEKEFVVSQYHFPQLLEIFELAGLHYGRIDFMIVEGDIQVFELNSAPSLLPRPPESRRYELRKKINNLVSDALLELGRDQSGGKSLTVPVPALWQARLRSAQDLARIYAHRSGKKLKSLTANGAGRLETLGQRAAHKWWRVVCSALHRL